MLEVPRERAELIRGLFELAAFVADHPELPVPHVEARFYAPFTGTADEQFEGELDLVGQLGEVLAVDPVEARGQVKVEAPMGSVRVLAIAYSPASRAQFEARNSYTDNVVTELVAGGAR
jgi:hypothetical protein